MRGVDLIGRERPLNGVEADMSEDGIQRELFGPRGVPGAPDPAKMTPQGAQKTSTYLDPGHPHKRLLKSLSQFSAMSMKASSGAVDREYDLPSASRKALMRFPSLGERIALGDVDLEPCSLNCCDAR
jgi:hypothetical protein